MRPANNILTLHKVMDRLFENSINRMQEEADKSHEDHHIIPRADAWDIIPRADAWENEDEVVIELSLPGVKNEDVDITFEKDTLTIAGKIAVNEEEKNWILRERRHGTFQRSFSLRAPIDIEKVEATYRDGLLVLRLPKSEASKPRKIAINAG